MDFPGEEIGERAASFIIFHAVSIRVYMEDSVFSVWSLSRKSIALEMLIFSFSQNSNNSFPFLKSVFMICILLLYMKRIRKMSYR